MTGPGFWPGVMVGALVMGVVMLAIQLVMDQREPATEDSP